MRQDIDPAKQEEEKYSKAIEIAMRNIRDVCKLGKQYTETSLRNFKKKNAHILADIKDMQDINEPQVWVQEICKRANHVSEDSKRILESYNGLRTAKENTSLKNSDNEDANDSDDDNKNIRVTNSKVIDKNSTKYNLGSYARNTNRTSSSSSSEEEDEDNTSQLLAAAIKSLKKVVGNNRRPPRIETLRSTSQNVTTWFRKFDLLTQKYEASEKAIEVVSYFEETAFEKFELLSSRKHNDYDEIKKHMMKHMKLETSLGSLKANFYSAKQRADETIEKFGHRLLTLVKEFPEDQRDTITNDLTVVFREGCDADIRKNLVTMTDANFSKLWKAAKDIESCKLKCNTTIAAIKDDEDSEQVDAISGECFNCHKTGHLARNCPNKNKAAQKPTSDEEKILDNQHIKKFCLFCWKNGHVAKDCFSLKETFAAKPSELRNHPTNTHNSPKYCSNCKRSGHDTKECRKKDKICFTCNKPGHVSTACPNKRKN